MTALIYLSKSFAPRYQVRMMFKRRHNNNLNKHSQVRRVGKKSTNLTGGSVKARAPMSLCMAPVTPEPTNKRTSSSDAFTHDLIMSLN
ncbi:hypothetical protein BpHYR1_029548 [Brachionus plicatilis]|uniref:Uncharacterized protein n=1 Tax=Brachionus plicatilis TaxID=10195 RepID=A0A3M7QNX0_BRAPC|nr:hypothetical protein BpHYR1_029548 [Brachionus plicatilis]